MSYGGYEYGAFEGGGGFGSFSFGNDTGGGGGGFMTEDKGTKSSEKKSRDRQSLMPLTVKQVLLSRNPDDSFKVDEVELNTVKLLGTLLDPTDHSTNFTFKLDDGSGVIECKQWIDKDSGEPSPLARVSVGSLVKVFGNIREYDGKLHILVFSAAAISDWNEVSYHTLDVILTHLQNTRPPIQTNSNVKAHQQFGTPVAGGYGSLPAASAGKVSLNNQQQSGESLTLQIYDVYVRNSNPTGLGYSEVLSVLGQKGIKITLDQLVKSVQDLCDNGRLYTTIDDEHYLPTNSD